MRFQFFFIPLTNTVSPGHRPCVFACVCVCMSLCLRASERVSIKLAVNGGSSIGDVSSAAHRGGEEAILTREYKSARAFPSLHCARQASTAVACVVTRKPEVAYNVPLSRQIMNWRARSYILSSRMNGAKEALLFPARTSCCCCSNFCSLFDLGSPNFRLVALTIFSRPPLLKVAHFFHSL